MLFLHIQCERGEKVSSPSVTIKRAEIEGLLDYSYALPEHPLLFLFLSLSFSLSLSFPYPFSRSPPRIGRKLHARFERCNVSIVYLRFREVQKRLSGISTGWILLLDCFTKDFKNIGKFVQLVTCDKLSLIIVSLISVRFDQVLYLLLRRNCNLVVIKWNYNKNK